MLILNFKSFLLFSAILLSVHLSLGQDIGTDRREIKISNYKINKRTISRYGGSTGFFLKEGILRKSLDSVATADLEVLLEVNSPGLYILEAESSTIDLNLLKKHDQSGKLTMLAKFKNGDFRPTYRILYDIYNGGRQEIGRFEINTNKQNLKIWLPNNLILNRLFIRPYAAPQTPTAAANYSPKITPPSEHPRLWLTKESLPIIRERLKDTSHAEAWAKIKQNALKEVNISFDPQKEMFYNEALEKSIEAKAFYYLMTNDKAVGQSAVNLALGYMLVLEFGNISYGDITREIGRAIYTASLVYDWCYPLMDHGTRKHLRTEIMRLARDMQMGWPPFYGQENIVNGHGNESQICRDLLSMSIAIYDEDPEPYKYVSYWVLEQLVPMRKFEYQSPRHNQGVDYGAYRFGWEMHAAWLYYRMLGYPVFNDNIKNLPNYWLYMRTPDGKMLRDGDMFNVKYNDGDNFYWKNPQTMLLSYAYSGNRLIKGEFLKQGGLKENPVLFLLLDDPSIKPDFDLSQLPLTKDFGPVLNSMIARTGWEGNRASGDVVAELKGGGFHFGNHQHADVGALQIYHRGIQVGDLGLYLSYGSPYDFNFNKRSVAHSMVLVRDPREKLLFRTKTNDGGTRFSQRFPRSPDEALTDSWFQTGFVRASSTGAHPLQPSFSYFNVDITAAYSEKVKDYTKSMLFLNLKRKDVPAVIVLQDRIISHQADMKKFWQINTITKPEYVNGKFVLSSNMDGKAGVTYLNMIKPAASQRTFQVFSGDSSTKVFDAHYPVQSPWPEARGSRIMISPNTDTELTEFATIFQVTESGAEELPMTIEEKYNYFIMRIADKMIVLAKPNIFLNEEIEVEVKDNNIELIFLGLKNGFWNLKQIKKQSYKDIHILNGSHSASWITEAGRFVMSPLRRYE